MIDLFFKGFIAIGGISPTDLKCGLNMVLLLGKYEDYMFFTYTFFSGWKPYGNLFRDCFLVVVGHDFYLDTIENPWPFEKTQCNITHPSSQNVFYILECFFFSGEYINRKNTAN